MGFNGNVIKVTAIQQIMTLIKIMNDLTFSLYVLIKVWYPQSLNKNNNKIHKNSIILYI